MKNSSPLLVFIAALVIADQLQHFGTRAAAAPPPPASVSEPPPPPPPRRARHGSPHRRAPPPLASSSSPPPPPPAPLASSSSSPLAPARAIGNYSRRSSSSTRTLLVFGDSTVDPGNNNRLRTTAKANFRPYGVSFYGQRPTGRFCDGRLATDIVADGLGIARTIPGFLDPTVKLGQLRKGVSFASAGSGFDDATASTLRAIPFRRQLWHLWRYKLLMRALLGPRRAERLVNRATFVISAGTNDMLLNYVASSSSSTSSTNRSSSAMATATSRLLMMQYETHLISRLANYTQVMRLLGGRRFVFVGLPPIGCLPITRTLLGAGAGGCDGELNRLAATFNANLLRLSSLISDRRTDTRGTYVDTYTVIQAATDDPASSGMSEVARGCCGSGMIEVGQTCRGRRTCQDPAKYLYWDAVHPTERTNQMIADVMLSSIRGIYS